MPPVHVVGVGPGSREYLYPLAEQTVRQAELLVGGQRLLNLFPEVDCPRLPIGGDLEPVLDLVAGEHDQKRVVVLASGDPGFFSVLPALRRRLGPGAIRVLPGISSLQLAFARLVLGWEEAVAVSLHGRPLENVLPVLECRRNLCLLLDRENNPARLARFLLQHGLADDRPLHIMADLGSGAELVETLSLTAALNWRGSGNCLVVLPGEGGE